MKLSRLLVSVLGILLFISSALRAQHNKESSKPNREAFDTSVFYSLNRASYVYLKKGELEQTLAYAKKAKIFAEQHSFKIGIARSLNAIASVDYRKSDYPAAIEKLNEALLLAQAEDSSLVQSISIMNLGNANSGLGNDVIALQYYFMGLAIEEKLPKKDQNRMVGYFSNIGEIYINQKNYPKALEYSFKAIEIEKERNQLSALAISQANVGNIYLTLGKSDSAIYYFSLALDVAEKAHDTYSVANGFLNLSKVYFKFKHYDKAYSYNIKSYELSKKQGYRDVMIENLINMGNIHQALREFDKAEEKFKEAALLSKETGSKGQIGGVFASLASLFEKKGDYRSAYEYYKLFTTTKDSILNKENSKLITEMNTKYSTEKKDLELATKRIELQRQRAISISVFVGLILILLLASLLLSRYRLKKKANKKLQVAYDEIEEKNKVIAKSNLRTTDSINYAKCIQDAILPAPEEIQKLLSDFFILYKPCQIVSGDFYWCSTQNNKIIVIVADCTGHGVPGAFMSMIGNTLLNEIINERKVTDPENIAQLLNEKIVEAMRQDASNGPNQHDGMDISICCIDQANKTITFTGANHKLYTYNGRLEKIKGDPFSIGGSRLEGLKKFSSKTISIEPDTRIYLQTDGYRDQSGGPDKKKFSSSQFETLLENIQGLSMGEQKEKLDATFEEWKGDMAQRDDVLVMGIKC